MDSINDYLSAVVEMQASDLHLKTGATAIIRVNRELIPIGSDILTSEKVKKMAFEILPPHRIKKFEEDFEIDFAYNPPGVGRFRTNIFFQRGDISIVMRHVTTEVPDFNQINLPAAILENFCSNERGIILVTGATNSGKSTTLATMINYINRHYRKHIITIEDPIEFVHHDRLSIINQREVGIDTTSFQIALKHVLRQDPDVIMVGEMRDADSFTTALQSAETGHLVLTTVHASGAPNTIDRILDFFKDPLQCDQARMQLANNLIGIISQRLLPKKDGSGLVPALEVLVGTGVAKNLIRENNLHKLPQLLSSGQDMGMCSFNKSILKLIQTGQVTKEVGLAHASNPEVLKMNMQGIFLEEGKILK